MVHKAFNDTRDRSKIYKKKKRRENEALNLQGNDKNYRSGECCRNDILDKPPFNPQITQHALSHLTSHYLKIMISENLNESKKLIFAVFTE